MFRTVLLVCVALALSGCGAVYISPSVIAKEDGSVQVVPLTAQVANAANSSTYNPKEIPAVFFQNAGAGGSLRGTGAIPDPVFDQQQRPRALELRVPPASLETPYQIGVGDVVLLATKSGNNTIAELSGLLAAQNRRQGYTVQDDGAIAVPDVGRIRIAGLTLEQAEAVIFQELVEQQINPSFSLEIAEFNSQRIYIGGAVGKPTVVPITLTGLNLIEAVSASGGISTPDLEFASIRLYRDGSLYQVPYKEYLRRADLQKLRLVAGDSIFVDTEFELQKALGYFQEQITLRNLRRSARSEAIAELQTEIALRSASLSERRNNFQARVALDAVDRDYVYLTGELIKPGRFELPFGRQATLADALYIDGGFNTESGDSSQIYVLRGIDGGARVVAYRLDAENVVNLVVATRLQMRPNDIVFVAEQPVTRWNRALQQILPTLSAARSFAQ